MSSSQRKPLANLPVTNSLDLLRLLFAFQVLTQHAFHHLDSSVDYHWILHLPGVPAFFFLSGLLIYASYDRSPSLHHYWQNRFLRLFPALFTVSLAGLIFAMIVKGSEVSLIAYLGWFAAQISLGQIYNPDWLRDVGVGVMNGVLWTITVEILFYLALPILIGLQRRWRFTLIVTLAISFAIYALGKAYLGYPVFGSKSIWDLVAQTPIVWGWMFIVGCLVYEHFNTLRRWFKLGWLGLPVMAALIAAQGDGPLFESFGAFPGLVYFLAFTSVICWAAFCLPAVSLPMDISYGVYVWHMLIINVLLVTGIKQSWLVFVLTVGVALLSAYFIERPALRLKKHSLLQTKASEIEQRNRQAQ